MPSGSGHRALREEKEWHSRSTSRPHRVAGSSRSPTSRRSRVRIRRSRCWPLCTRRAGATTTAASPRATRAAATSAQYRIIDFKRKKDGVPAKVATIEYDPNRSARIALLHYADGEKRYILAARASLPSVTPSPPAPARTSSRATASLWPTSRPVPSCTRSSCSRARERRWPVPRARRSS